LRHKGDVGFSIAFLSPALILYTTYVLFTVGISLYYTLMDWPGVGPATFNGIRNYIDMVKDPEYWQVTKNTFKFTAMAVLFQNPVSLILAFAVARIGKGYRIFRSALFMPVVIPMVATGLLFSLLLNSDYDVFNSILRTIGLGFLQRDWLTDPKVVIFSVAVPQLWQYVGIHFIIYLAAIQSIPNEIFESALLDGASRIRTITKIVIPLIWDVVTINIILNITGTLRSFDFPWIMTWGGPGLSSAYISVLMYKHAIKGFNFSYGTTIAMTILIYSLFFLVLFRIFFSRKTYEY
jgi:raffinose/stachyose/melibiose transport system permease protein